MKYFIWALAVLIALGIGIYAGHRVTAAYKDTEIMELKANLDSAREEVQFWRQTLKMLAEGGQLQEIK